MFLLDVNIRFMNPEDLKPTRSVEMEVLGKLKKIKPSNWSRVAMYSETDEMGDVFTVNGFEAVLDLSGEKFKVALEKLLPESFSTDETAASHIYPRLRLKVSRDDENGSGDAFYSPLDIYSDQHEAGSNLYTVLSEHIIETELINGELQNTPHHRTPLREIFAKAVMGKSN
jgi:hypothetical protein